MVTRRHLLIMKNYDFEKPLRVQEIFKGAEDSLEAETEFVQITALRWPDIIEVKNYPYDDELHWKVQRGPKFYIVSQMTGPMLVQGSFKEFLNLWEQYIKFEYSNGENPDS